MKWLFGVLVALNIIVFAGRGGRTCGRAPKEALAPAVPMASGTQELGLPASVQRPSVAAGAASAPGWVHGADDVPASAVLAADEAAERAREQENKEKSAKRAKKKPVASSWRRKKAQQDAPSQSAQCRPTASITLDEDDYHRIKGLLAQWPHAATRTVEQRGSAPAKPAAASKATACYCRAAAMPWRSWASCRKRALAALCIKAKSAWAWWAANRRRKCWCRAWPQPGFSGAYVAEQQESAKAAPADSSLACSRMQVLFMSVDDKAAKGIQAVVGG